MGQWRASHAPGENFVLLVGRSSALVVPADSGLGLIEQLWGSLQHEATLGSLLRTVTSSALADVNEFVLLVRDGDAVRCLVRGGIEVCELDSGRTLVDGRGVKTWREASLASVHAVRIGEPDVARETAMLPLVMGAALVGHVDVVFDQLDTPAGPADAGVGHSIATSSPAQGLHCEPTLSELDHDAEPTLAMAPAQGADAQTTDVLGVRCERGHVNVPGSQSCRVCGAPVSGAAAPQQLPAPSLAMLVASHGETLELTGPVLVGRAPSAEGHPRGVRLLTVPSPNQDISRTHLLINPTGWAIEATDLASTNGSYVRRAGNQVTRLAAHRPTTVHIGDVLDLGDGVTLAIVHPTL